MGHDIPHVARDLLALLRDLVVAKTCAEPGRLLDLPDEEAKDVRQLAAGADPDDLLRLHQGFAQGFDDVVRSGQPRAALEMLLVRLARRPPLVPIDHLLQRLSQLERRLAGGGGPTRPAPGPGGAGGSGGPAHHSGPGPAPRSSAPVTAGAAPPPTARPRDSHPAPSARPDNTDERKEPPRGTSPANANANGATRPAPASAAPRSGPGVRPSQAPRSAPEPLDLEETLRLIVARIASERLELAAKLEHGVLLEAAPGRLLFGWAPDNLFGELVASPENTAVIEQAASAVLGTPCRVSHERDSARAAGKKTLSHLEAEARERRTREAYEKARQHPRIAEAVEILGARLKDLKLAKGS
jgi:DNA polymerase-3 subunit gamma/tau